MSFVTATPSAAFNAVAASKVQAAMAATEADKGTGKGLTFDQELDEQVRRSTKLAFHSHAVWVVAGPWHCAIAHVSHVTMHPGSLLNTGQSKVDGR